MELTKTKTTMVIIGMCLLIVLTGPAQAGKTEENSAVASISQTRMDSASMMSTCNIVGRAGTLQSADELIGMTVQNLQGETLGTIEDMILDESRQMIQYVVLSSSGVLHPVPWSALDTGTDSYTLDISSDLLRRSPMVTSLEIAQFTRQDFQTMAQDYYSGQISAIQNKAQAQHAVGQMLETARQARMQSQATSQLYSSNHLIGFDVRDAQSKTLGQLNDIVFDVREGSMAYGLISFGGIFGMGERTAAVPWESVELKSGMSFVSLNADKSALRDAVLPDGDLNMLCEPTFARQIHQGFGQEPYWEVLGYIPPTPAVTEYITGAAWSADSTYSKNFNLDTIETLRGTVTKVSTFSPGQDASPGLRLKVEIDDGRSMTIYAGPRQFYMQQAVRFQKGDSISITGSRTTVGRKNVMMACQVSKGAETFRIRTLTGAPLWSTSGAASTSTSSQTQQEVIQ